MWLDLGLEFFWRKGEKSLLNIEEFLGGIGEAYWVDFYFKNISSTALFCSMDLSVTKSTGIFPRY